EAGAGGTKAGTPTPSIYLTQELARDISNSTLVHVLKEEEAHAQDKAAGNYKTEKWKEKKLTLLYAILKNIELVQRYRRELRTLIPFANRRTVTHLLAESDFELLHDAAVRQLNLQDRNYAHKFANQWQNSPVDALHWLAKGPRTRHDVTIGKPLKLFAPP